MLKSLDSFSNFIRAVVSLGVLGVVGAGGWLGWNHYHGRDLALERTEGDLKAALQERDDLARDVATQKEEIGVLQVDVAAKAREIERLATALNLLKVDHRIAQIDVLRREEGVPGDASTLTTTFTFVEVDGAGQPLEQPRQFTIDGDVVYVEAWVVKFEDKLVEEGDPLRGTSICLFRRIFGEHQQPSEGFPIEAVGSRPAAYSRGSEPSDVEKEIWTNFWDYATDRAKAQAAGVRVADVEAKANKLLPGKRYRVELRSSGGLSIVPEDAPQPSL